MPDAALPGAGVPDAFGRLWTPHRLAYIQGGGKPTGPGAQEGCPFCIAPTLTVSQPRAFSRTGTTETLKTAKITVDQDKGEFFMMPQGASIEQIAETGSIPVFGQSFVTADAVRYRQYGPLPPTTAMLSKNGSATAAWRAVRRRIHHPYWQDPSPEANGHAGSIGL